MLNDVKVIIVVLFLSVLFGCNHKQPKVQKIYKNADAAQTVYYVDPALFDEVEFVDNSKAAPTPYLVMNVSYPSVNDMRRFIEAKEKVTLKTRGEAHITVITPPEFEKLRSYMTMELINEVASLNRIQETPFEVVCLGRGVKKEDNKTLQTYFVVVDAPELLEIRHKVATIFKSHGGQSADFNADEFYPHITVGFTERDLHVSDGVIKNKSSCFNETQLKAQ